MHHALLWFLSEGPVEVEWLSRPEDAVLQMLLWYISTSVIARLGDSVLLSSGRQPVEHIWGRTNNTAAKLNLPRFNNQYYINNNKSYPVYRSEVKIMCLHCHTAMTTAMSLGF